MLSVEGVDHPAARRSVAGAHAAAVACFNLKRQPGCAFAHHQCVLPKAALSSARPWLMPDSPQRPPPPLPPPALILQLEATLDSAGTA